jgi:predicted DNA-binding transcriptional regulator
MRNTWALRVGQAIEDVTANVNAWNSVQIALAHLEAMRLASLEPNEREVYEWIAEREAPVLSNDVARKFNINQNHASMILKALTAYGLLRREAEHNENGKRYIYRLV